MPLTSCLSPELMPTWSRQTRDSRAAAANLELAAVTGSMDFLIIDDDKAFRDATRFLIEDEGHYAEGAPSGTAGRARLKESRFDSVILDLNLEQENGIDVLVEILKTQPRLPVVISTAQGSIKSAVEAMQRGAIDYLEKPFTRTQLH